MPPAHRHCRRGGAAPAAYNEEMLHALQQMLAPAVMERLTLLANHVLAGESVATDPVAAGLQARQAATTHE